MKQPTDMQRAEARLPGIWRTLVLSAFLGVGVSIVVIACEFFFYVFVYDALASPYRRYSANPWAFVTDPLEAGDFRYLAFLLAGFLAIVLILASGSFLAAAIGGGLNGLYLRQLALTDRMNAAAIVIGGCAVGFSAGWVTAVFLYPSELSGGTYVNGGDPLWAGVLGAFWGLIHSWILGRWLKRRMG